MAHHFIITPTDEELKQQAGWKSKGNLKSVIRYVLLVEEEIVEDRKGRVVSTQYRIPGDKFIQTKKITEMVTKTDEVEETFSKTFSDEMTQAVSAQLGGTLSLATLAAILDGKVQYQHAKKITNTIQQVLRKKESFSWKVETEDTRSIEQQTQSPKNSVAYRTHYLLREHIWRIYLVGAEYFSFKYNGHWIPWFDSKKESGGDFKKQVKPIYKIRFYEPYPEFSYTNQDYKADIPNEKEIIIRQFNGPMEERRLPHLTSLEELAAFAFPVGKQERTVARKHKAVKKGGVKKAAKKAAPKKAAKKAAPKKAVKKAAPKKAAKKKAARKK